MFEKFNTYVGVRGVLALALIGAVIYLALTKQALPAELVGLAGAAAGFYFGTKGATAAVAIARKSVGIPQLNHTHEVIVSVHEAELIKSGCEVKLSTSIEEVEHGLDG